MFVQLVNKPILSLILAILFLPGGMCKCILAHGYCYLESNQEEACLDEHTTCDIEDITTNNHQKDEDNNCCPVQCLFKNNDLAGEPTYFSLNVNLDGLLAINYVQDFISMSIFSVKPIWQKARAPSPSFNLQSQNSILRI